jgi:hypothetical protein
MDSFEYLIALVSVIAGLGITRSLSGMARLLDARRNVKYSWIPILWTASSLLWLVAFWWFTYLLSTFEGWTPALHIFMLVYAGAIFFLLALLHPESISDDYDMMQRFLDNKRMFFGTFVIVALIDVAHTWIMFHLGMSLPPLLWYVVLMVSWVTVGTIAMFIGDRAFHTVFALLFFVVMMLWLYYNISNIMEVVGGQGAIADTD